MIEHLFFITYIYVFLISTIGYGTLFSRIFFNRFLQINIGYLGIIGFFTLSIYSILSSFFLAHNQIHNMIIHFIGIISFVAFFLNKKKKLKELKFLLIITTLLIIGAYVFKNHDDFPYYHLTYSLNLTENSFIIGTGIFSHGFRTFSSLFYYHSLLYMPFIKFYLFHIGPFFILVFFNCVIINKIKEIKDLNKIEFIYYFSLLSLVFVNVVFYRIGEHGTDRSSQILLLLIFIIFFELILLKLDSETILVKVNLLVLIILLSSSIKAIYYLYFLIVPILFLNKKIFINYFKNFNFALSFIFFLSIFLNLLTYYFNTGCLLYPAKFTCVGDPIWQLPLKQVELMKIHYEWWAKAGGGAGYASDIPKEDYVENFIWFSNWIERHFFNKVSDTLFGIFFICILLLVALKIFSKRKNKSKKIPIYIYLIPLFFLFEWFLNHPTMRYGGYVLFAIPLFMLTASYASKHILSIQKVSKITLFFIIISILIFNARNVVRINKEANVYGYNIIKSPFFFVENIKSKIIYDKNNFKVYTTEDGNMCWAVKTPCSYHNKVKVVKFLWMNVVLPDVK